MRYPPEHSKKLPHEMLPRHLSYLTNCINSNGPAINKMKDLAKPIAFETFSRRVSMKLIAEHVSDVYGPGFPLEKDWHVGYFKSWYQGQPCYYLVWSAIEYIFV